MIAISCPNCHRSFTFPDLLAGQKVQRPDWVQCPSCQKMFMAQATARQTAPSMLLAEPPLTAPVKIPLVSVAQGELPDRFEGWEFRYRVLEKYTRAYPGWGRSMVAAISVQFPGASAMVMPVVEDPELVVVSAPQGVPEPLVRRAQEVANLVRKKVLDSPWLVDGW
jgi:hypothetical protein